MTSDVHVAGSSWLWEEKTPYRSSAVQRSRARHVASTLELPLPSFQPPIECTTTKLVQAVLIVRALSESHSIYAMLSIQPPTSSSNPPSSQPPKFTANILPCRISHNGAVNASKRYWNVERDENGRKVAYFRGRKLLGREVRIPKDYRGRHRCGWSKRAKGMLTGWGVRRRGEAD